MKTTKKPTDSKSWANEDKRCCCSCAAAAAAAVTLGVDGGGDEAQEKDCS